MKKALRSVVAVVLIVVLCTALVQPSALYNTFARETKIHTQWKQAAKQVGAVHSYEEELYYTDSDPKDITALTDSVGYVNNEVIVYFDDDTTTEQKQTIFDSIGGTVIGHTDVLNKYQLQIKENDFLSLQKLCHNLRKNAHVSFAHCNMALQRKEDVVPDDPWLDQNGYSAAYGWDNSYLYGGNWWLIATQTTDAWENEKYFNPICIGVLDSGFDTTHEDLQGKFRFPAKKYERTNIPSSHGTHVSGILSANANNGVGITGICNNAELLCVDWQPEETQTWLTDERIFTGFIALVKGGAKIINMSLGSSGGFTKSSAFFWDIGMYFEGMLYSYTVASLLSKGYDFLVVQSAGNGDKDGKPCNSKYNGSFACISKRNIFTGRTGISKQEVLDHILIVGSCTSAHNDTKFYQSSFSNYGDSVSLFAPGSMVFSTDLMKNGGYCYKSGTSMAAPVVTGIAALTWSVNPALRGAEVKAILCDPDNAVYKCANYYNEDMHIPEYNMVNAKLSVEAAIRTLNTEEPTTELPVTEPETTEPDVTIHDHTIVPQAETNTTLHRSDRKWIEKFRGEIGE